MLLLWNKPTIYLKVMQLHKRLFQSRPMFWFYLVPFWLLPTICLVAFEHFSCFPKLVQDDLPLHLVDQKKEGVFHASLVKGASKIKPCQVWFTSEANIFQDEQIFSCSFFFITVKKKGDFYLTLYFWHFLRVKRNQHWNNSYSFQFHLFWQFFLILKNILKRFRPKYMPVTSEKKYLTFIFLLV